MAVEGESQYSLLNKRRFGPFFFTQFLGAFNDNVFKNSLLILIAFQIAGPGGLSTNTLINISAGLFILPFFLSVWLLNQVPEPDAEDIEQRVEREQMDGSDRWAFIKQFLLGLIMLLVVYFFLTAYRDFRDNYGIEILKELGYGEAPAIFTTTELPIAFGVLAALAGLNLIRNNRLGLIGAFVVMTFGTVLMGVSTLLIDAGMISGCNPITN